MAADNQAAFVAATSISHSSLLPRHCLSRTCQSITATPISQSIPHPICLSQKQLSIFDKIQNPLAIITKSYNANNGNGNTTNSKSTANKSPPVRNAQIVVLTDFQADPLKAVRDRVSDPLFSGLLVSSTFLALIISRLFSCMFSSSSSSRTYTSASANNSSSISNSMNSSNSESPSVHTNSFWLNQAIKPIWILLQKPIASSIQSSLQPALNQLKYPAVIRDIQIVSVSPGDSPITVQNVTRIASRSLSDIQLLLDVIHTGLSMNLTVFVRLPFDTTIELPVTIEDVQIQASAWASFLIEPPTLHANSNDCISLVRPYAWALKDKPSEFNFSVRIANVIPLTSIPSISNSLADLFTNELPKHFTLPNAVKITNEADDDEEYTSKWLERLFNTLDIGDKNAISDKQLANGLIEWGFASKPDTQQILNVLSDRNKNLTSTDLVDNWDSLQNAFIPRRYHAVVTCKIVQANNIRRPYLGSSKPFIYLCVDSDGVESDVCSQYVVDKRTKTPSVTWNGELRLFIQEPKNAYMRIEVLESSSWALYPTIKRKQLSSTSSTKRTMEQPETEGTDHYEKNTKRSEAKSIIAVGYIPLYDYDLTTSQNVWVELTEGGGWMNLDIKMEQFIEPQFQSF